MGLGMIGLRGIGLSGGVYGRGLPFRGDPATYRIYTDDFAVLTGWSTPNGGVSVADGVATLTDPAGAQIFLSRNFTGSSAFPTTYPYVVECIASVASGQAGFFDLVLANLTMRARMLIGGSAGDNKVRLSTQGTSQATFSPTNFDMTATFRLRFLVDPVAGRVRFYLCWKDTTTALGRVEEIGAATTWTYTTTSQPAGLSIFTGEATTGNVTVRTLRIYRVWAVIIGDSIATGRPPPYPNVADTPLDDSIAYWLEAASGNRAYVLNQGIGGDATTQLLARYQAMILNVAPEIAIIEIGSNDAFSEVLADAQARLTTVVAACVAAGIETVCVEIPPRDNMDAAANVFKAAWNAWLPGFCAAQGAYNVICHDLLEDPANPDKLLPAYTFDNIHPDADGYHVMATQTWLRL